MRQDEHTLAHLLDSMERAAENEAVSINDVLHEIGDRAITPLILIVALLLVSPLSGIPGVSTRAAVTIILLAVQAVTGRRRLWMPQFLLRREVAGHRLSGCVRFLRRPCAFVDGRCKPRLQFLTTGKMRFITLVVVTLLVVTALGTEGLPIAALDLGRSTEGPRRNVGADDTCFLSLIAANPPPAPLPVGCPAALLVLLLKLPEEELRLTVEADVLRSFDCDADADAFIPPVAPAPPPLLASLAACTFARASAFLCAASSKELFSDSTFPPRGAADSRVVEGPLLAETPRDRLLLRPRPPLPVSSVSARPRLGGSIS